MKKVMSLILGLTLALGLVVAQSDPNPPPTQISLGDEVQINTYSDPNPPPTIRA